MSVISCKKKKKKNKTAVLTIPGFFFFFHGYNYLNRLALVPQTVLMLSRL